MSKELFKTLTLPVKEEWIDGNLTFLGVLDSTGRPLKRHELPPPWAYERFKKLLTDEGYLVIDNMSFAPGRGALPTNIAVIGNAPESRFEENIGFAIQQASLTPYTEGSLYSDWYDSLGNRSLRRGNWAFQEFNLHFADPTRFLMFGPEGAKTPDSFNSGTPSIECVVRQLEKKRHFTLVSNSELRQNPSWSVPLSVIIANEGMVFSKGLFGSLIRNAGLPAYSSGQAYFSQQQADKAHEESPNPAYRLPV